MTEPLPSFRYHPDPISSGVVRPSDRPCICCGKFRGFIYIGPVYAEKELDENICPWCIADGSAAAEFQALFTDDYPLILAGLPTSVVEEVSSRTPGFVSWQQEDWLAHCGDACEFHGDATREEAERPSPETLAELFRRYQMNADDWAELCRGYQPGGDPAVYKFLCRRCGLTLFGWDCT